MRFRQAIRTVIRTWWLLLHSIFYRTLLTSELTPSIKGSRSRAPMTMTGLRATDPLLSSNVGSKRASSTVYHSRCFSLYIFYFIIKLAFICLPPRLILLFPPLLLFLFFSIFSFSSSSSSSPLPLLLLFLFSIHHLLALLLLIFSCLRLYFSEKRRSHFDHSITLWECVAHLGRPKRGFKVEAWLLRLRQ